MQIVKTTRTTCIRSDSCNGSSSASGHVRISAARSRLMPRRCSTLSAVENQRQRGGSSATRGMYGNGTSSPVTGSVIPALRTRSSENLPSPEHVAGGECRGKGAFSRARVMGRGVSLAQPKNFRPPPRPARFPRTRLRDPSTDRAAVVGTAVCTLADGGGEAGELLLAPPFSACFEAELAGEIENGTASGGLRGEPDGVEAVGGPG